MLWRQPPRPPREFWKPPQHARIRQVSSADKTTLNELSERIIGCAFRVLNTLEAGFLEKVYENALAYELCTAGLAVAQQRGVTVRYNSIVFGEYVVDLLVEETIIVELKASMALEGVHTAQCINYLKATGMPLCLLLNFCKSRLEIHRFAHSL